MSTAVLEPSRQRAPAHAEQRRESTIHIRAPRQTKELIDSAASVVGKSRTEFILDSARKDAIDVLLDQRLFVLDPDQYDAFMKALDNPPPAGARLKALMKRRPRWQK
jgi:uncharacterized protein (DUF1778 family)